MPRSHSKDTRPFQNIFQNYFLILYNYLYMNLRYYDNLETAYINIDLKLSELQDQANKRENIIEELKNSYVSPSNTNIPYVWMFHLIQHFNNYKVNIK